jgi:flagellar biosynthesis protein FlhG
MFQLHYAIPVFAFGFVHGLFLMSPRKGKTGLSSAAFLAVGILIVLAFIASFSFVWGVVTLIEWGAGIFVAAQFIPERQSKSDAPDQAIAPPAKVAAPIVPEAPAPIKRRSRVSPASIICIASGKGGVGKTWLSTTLAACFAKMGRRTLLVDGDLGLSNVDALLGLAPETDLAAVIAGWVKLEDAVCKVNGGAGSEIGFDVLPGRSGSGALAGLPAEEASRLAASLTALASQYDTVLVDLGTGIEDNVMRLARACDRCVIVANDEPTSMTDAYAFIKVLRGYAPSVQPWIAINMADTRVAGRRTYEALARASQTFLGFRPPLAGIVLRDLKVREAIRQQKTIVSIDPQAQAALDAQQIAEALIRGGAEGIEAKSAKLSDEEAAGLSTDRDGLE